MHRRPINFLDQNQPHPLFQHISGEKTRIHKTRRLIFLTLLISFILIFAGCLTKIIVGKYAPSDPNAYDPITLKPKTPTGFVSKLKYYIFSQENALIGQSKDRINILLFGIGGEGHDGAQLTDTIMLASIKPSTNQIAMISIPRDLAVDIPGYGIHKINNANAYAEMKKFNSGPEFAKKIIEDTFDIQIPYYIRIDFKAFEEIIDELGGVTVEVEKNFTDQMYPTANGDYQTITFEKGIQTLNGDLALKFTRSRHGNNSEGSDFARAKRQQKIILAMKEKALSFGTLANPFRINNIYNTLQKHITTNLTFADMMELIRLSRTLNTKKIINIVLDDSPNGYLKSYIGADSAFLLEPVEGSGNFNKIKELTNNVFNQGKLTTNNTPEQTPPTYQEAKIEIVNGTWRAGLAARMKKRLEEKNYLVTTIGNANNRPQNISGIYIVTNTNFTSITSALQGELHIPIRQSLPTDIQSSTSTDILVLLGDDMLE